MGGDVNARGGKLDPVNPLAYGLEFASIKDFCRVLLIGPTEAHSSSRTELLFGVRTGPELRAHVLTTGEALYLSSISPNPGGG